MGLSTELWGSPHRPVLGRSGGQLGANLMALDQETITAPA